MTDPRHGQQTIHSQRPWGDIHMVVRNQDCSVDIVKWKIRIFYSKCKFTSTKIR